MDRLTPKRRSWNMGRIRGRDTAPERAVRSALHRLGFRFRLRGAGLPGRPDVVLGSFRTVVFVHGCFWHRHSGCCYAYTPKSNISFWTAKFSRNVARDQKVHRTLLELGWRIVVVWECQTADVDGLIALLGSHPALSKKLRVKKCEQ
jgi:DNA mismatch endonuclease, patch repair protein